MEEVKRKSRGLRPSEIKERGYYLSGPEIIEEDEIDKIRGELWVVAKTKGGEFRFSRMDFYSRFERAVYRRNEEWLPHDAFSATFLHKLNLDLK